MTQTAGQKASLLRQAAADAVAAAQALRDRVRAGDGLVTGKQLAEADANVEIAELRAQAAHEAARAEQEAQRVAICHAAADEWLQAEPAARSDFAAAITAARTALQAVVDAGREQHAANDNARATAEMHSSGDFADRLTRTPGLYGQVTVDRKPLRDVTVAEWIAHLAAEAIKAAGGDQGRLLDPPKESIK